MRAALEEGIVAAGTGYARSRCSGASGKVSGVRCQRMALGEPDADGRRQPVPVKDSTFDLPADTVLVAVGEAPDPSFLPPERASAWLPGAGC